MRLTISSISVEHLFTPMPGMVYQDSINVTFTLYNSVYNILNTVFKRLTIQLVELYFSQMSNCFYSV